jgi:hypothetical protein
MTILIEDAESQEYLSNKGEWTKNATAGKSFATSRAAVLVAKQELIGKFNVVCYIPQTQQMINLDHGRGLRKAEVISGQ